MNIDYVLGHMAYVFCFWLVWRFFDLGWHLFDVQVRLDRIAGKKNPNLVLAEVVKTRSTKDDQAKLATGMVAVINSIGLLKKDMKSLSERFMLMEKINYTPCFDVTPARKKGRNRKLGIQKLEPIPFADKPVPRGSKKIKKSDVLKMKNFRKTGS